MKPSLNVFWQNVYLVVSTLLLLSFLAFLGALFIVALAESWSTEASNIVIALGTVLSCAILAGTFYIQYRASERRESDQRKYLEKREKELSDQEEKKEKSRIAFNCHNDLLTELIGIVSNPQEDWELKVSQAYTSLGFISKIAKDLTDESHKALIQSKYWRLSRAFPDILNPKSIGELRNSELTAEHFWVIIAFLLSAYVKSPHEIKATFDELKTKGFEGLPEDQARVIREIFPNLSRFLNREE